MNEIGHFQNDIEIFEKKSKNLRYFPKGKYEKIGEK